MTSYFTIRDLVLKHAEEPYDPVKRREYYLRTRELKGRNKGSEEPQSEPSGAGGPETTTFESDVEERKTESEKRQEELKQRITQLKVKLEELRNVLRKLVAEAKLRSGVKPEDIEDDKPKDSEKKESKPKKELTEAEKAEAAEAAKERREEEAAKTPDQRIAALEAQIAETRVKIEEALAKARKQIEESKKNSDQDEPKAASKAVDTT